MPKSIYRQIVEREDRLSVEADAPFDTKALAGYFGQGRHYHSTTRNEVLWIAAMPARHCANAAEKLIREADAWAQDCGIDTAHPVLWMTTTALFQSLAKRGAQEA